MAPKFAFLMAVAAMVPGPVQAQTAAHNLIPTSSWVLDYGQERCSLNRAFAAGNQQLRLRIDSYGSRTGYRVLMFGSAVASSSRETDEVRVRLTPDPAPLPYHTLNGKYGADPAVSFSIVFRTPANDEDDPGRSPKEIYQQAAEARQPDLDFERKTENLDLRFRNGHEINVQLASMAAPLKAMRTWVDNLQTTWGLQPVREQKLSRWAAPRPQSVRRLQQHYPPPMLLSGTNAFVPVRIMIGADGTATSCVVQVASVNIAFTDAVCAKLTGAFDPALDEAGQPVASFFQTGVIFLIGG